MYYGPIFQLNSMFTEEESKELSKQRIIQKNLVHFQGFPDRLYSKELLSSQEYFGQYGLISKIILTNKMDKKSNKKSNSAYITFSTFEQAAYAILSVDSIKIDNQLVRAFFGTTKYCNHFLNNFNCFNSEKCMFLHYLADKNDIIAENSKFGYSEHIKLAKKIIGFGSIQSQLYVMNNSNKGKSILPNIITIYHKDDILMKTKNHRRKKSNESDSSNNNANADTTRSSSNSSKNSSNEKDTDPYPGAGRQPRRFCANARFHQCPHQGVSLRGCRGTCHLPDRRAYGDGRAGGHLQQEISPHEG